MTAPLLYYSRQIKVILLLLVVCSSSVWAQRPLVKQWAKSFGGSDYDEAQTIIQTADGGYMIGGRTNSIDGQVTDNVPYKHNWIIRTDGDGNITWKKSYSSDGSGVYSIIQTRDGGFAATGMTAAANPTDPGNLWVLKIDANGNIQWERTYGGSYQDIGHSIIQTPEGGYAIAGTTGSFDRDITDRPTELTYEYDFWVLKLNAGGAIQWSQTYGGSAGDIANCIINTQDGGYAVAGQSYSKDGDINDHKGNLENFWVIKMASDGTMQWRKSYSDGGTAAANNIVETANGYAIAGLSDFFNLGYDYWLIFTDKTGQYLSGKTYGGSDNEYLRGLVPTKDGGFVMAGSSASTDGDRKDAIGDADFWVLSVKANGDINWSKSFGGTGADLASAVIVTAGEGLIVAGRSTSVDNDVTAHFGGNDYWVVKLGHKIATSPTISQQYCTGYSIIVRDTLFGTFNADNTFTIQLSDANGSFASPVAIGVFPNNNKDSSLLGLIPDNTPAGTGYRVRIVSTSPQAIYTDNGEDIIIHQSPGVAGKLFGNDTILCNSNMLVLQAPVLPGYEYRWQNNSIADNFTVTTPGKYFVQVTNSLGCSTSDTINVEFKPAPVFTLGNDTIICSSETAMLQPNLPSGNYLWSDNSTSPALSLTNSGEYWLNVSLGGCTVSDTINVTLKPSPVISFGADTVACEGRPLILNAANTGATYIWQDGSTQSEFTVSQPGLYSVTAMLDGCKTTAAVQVKYQDCACTFSVPTAFSPNNDTKNELFRPRNKCTVAGYELKIFNRWGQLVFRSTNQQATWNGITGGHAQPMGAYVWQLQYKDSISGKLRQEKGVLTLIR